ncbi:extracellular solute-binding protein [Paenibacillus sp. LHD-38]|uniref:extracellular solute-binding protein n=1 Tax=Paenibacillus sp. LHD-38 TaxID=3072143 RepID=UPI00280CA0BF|nr:extracellular solute-binding protein [Paenibacillus sp. LHD-38]MDQ8735604.1 extracellular solute-binding protein [Paenibacillus sp. LHD-38]
MFRKKSVVLLLITVIITGIIAGCSSNSSNQNGNEPSSTGSDNTSGQSQADNEIVDLEVWNGNTGFKGVEKGSPLYNFYVDLLGVGYISPYVEWNGGTDYLNALNTKIAAGEMPNVFLPFNGNEADLARNGAIADLTELLPKYAPKLWERISEEVWNIVKANDPTGQGRIYWVPGINSYEKTTGLIRKDWLEKLGLEMPQTQAEYVNALKAFKEKDPNSNNKADEIPTGGRENARWMDHLFNQYGVAMLEGFPDWDIYDGKLTFSAVTPNMKDALAFISALYKEKLLDQETFLNDKAAWDGKIDNNTVGNYYHWGQGAFEHLEKLELAAGVKADIAVLPVLEAPGYEGKGYISTKQVGRPEWVVSAQQDEKHLIASLKFLNSIADESKWLDIYMGVEGMHHEVVDGKKVKLPEDKSTQQNGVSPFYQFGSMEFQENLLLESATQENKWRYDQSINNMRELQQFVKVIEGDGLPSSIYENYPDIRNNTLWFEYATKIIIGTYPIEKFDEFVEKWNKSGGEEVTKKAREWYAKVK